MVNGKIREFVFWEGSRFLGVRERELDGKQGEDGVKGREYEFYEKMLNTHVIRGLIHTVYDSSCANSKCGIYSGM